jgi:hypothetical protein
MLQMGCATIFDGSKPQEVKVQSSPSGAGVYSNGAVLGKTPTTLTLERNKEHMLELRMSGYQPTQIWINREFNTTSLFNIGWFLCGGIPGIVGFAVDFATGAIYELDPTEVSAQLNRSGAESSWHDGEVFVFITLEPQPEWELVEYMEPIEQ